MGPSAWGDQREHGGYDQATQGGNWPSQGAAGLIPPTARPKVYGVPIQAIQSRWLKTARHSSSAQQWHLGLGWRGNHQRRRSGINQLDWAQATVH